MTKRLVWVCAVLFGLGFVVLWAADGPLTPLMNLGARTDANGYLLTTMGVYQSPETPLTPMSNLRGRTDSNGYLITSMASGATVPVGTGAATASINGTLTSSVTGACTIADTTETDLWSYSLPAAALAANGRGVRITVWGTTGATANSKTVKLAFGAQTLVASSNALNNGAWRTTAVVLRTGAATQIADADLVFGGWAGAAQAATTPSETLSGAVTIRMSGTNGVAAANDICFKGAVVEAIGNP